MLVVLHPYHHHAEGSADHESAVPVAAKELKFQRGVRCLLEPDTIIGCEYHWCGMEGIVVCVCVVGKMYMCRDGSP